MDYPQSVHPGRGLGRDGDHRWGGCGACGCGETFIMLPGAEGRTRGYYGPRAFSGKTTLAANRDTVRSRALSELSLRQKPPQKRGRRICVNRRTTRPAFLRGLRSRNPSLLSLPRKRHNRFHQGRSCARRSLTIEYVIKGPHPPSGPSPMQEHGRRPIRLAPSPVLRNAVKRDGRRWPTGRMRAFQPE